MTSLRPALAVLTLLVIALLGAAPADAAARPFRTAVAEPDLASEDGPLLAQRIAAAGGSAVRMWISWRAVAPPGATRPEGFNARDPADPAYRWATADRMVATARAAGLEPILTLSTAPEWAERRQPEDAQRPGGENKPGTVRPDPAEFGLFAEALARRYSGSFQGLPRVRWFQAWNEPNHQNDLNPQFAVGPFERAQPDSPITSVETYRALLRAFGDAVHAVHADNVVVAGGLAPFFRPDPGGRAAAPLTFMRALLCLSRRNRPLPDCAPPLPFDAWAVHPYTSGDADHSANSPDDVSLGDLPAVRRVLDAAVRAGRVKARGRVPLWVTEFSWDSNPPDRYGVPDRLLTRWVAEALHRMWQSGVEVATWFQVRDQPAAPAGRFQSGLYRRCDGGVRCDRAKPMLAAFRFPVVAYRKGTTIRVWGRAPGGARAAVVIEQRVKGRWRPLARLRAGGSGIFQRRARARGTGDVRARMTAPRRLVSPAFSLKRVPDRPVNPFGDVPVDES